MLSTEETAVRESIDHLFRRYAGQMVSVLARHFGYQNLELIEDGVQDALVAAMKKWPFTGTPQNPRAWLTETARNRVIDQLRRGTKSETIADDAAFLSCEDDPTLFAGEIEQDEIRMMFACCHPAIPTDAQVALTLKTVGGFSVGEIARAFISNNEAVAKTLTRAKAKLRSNAAGLEVPSQEELVRRRDAVLKVLYLMFNEGYAATDGDELVRKDLCFEAIRLASIISRHQLIGAPMVHALLALFLFQAARLDTRIDTHGELLLLENQDRGLWKRAMLGEGLRHFRLSAAGDEVSDYHLESEIAAEHALAIDFAATNWQRILSCYDRLQSRSFSPVTELNRVVAIGKIHGPERALDELTQLTQNYPMIGFNLLHVTKGHFLAESGKPLDALASYEKALQLTSNATVKRFISAKIETLRTHRWS